MLICIELSELIIYCKYALKLLVFDIFLYYTFVPIHSSLTYKRHMRDTPYTKPENLRFCYEPISMPNNITREYRRRIKNPV